MLRSVLLDIQGRRRVIGAAGTHVDDFQIAGDDNDPRWIKVRANILWLYEWGSSNRGAHLHAGINVVQALPDIGIENMQLASNIDMSQYDVKACGSSLGSLQWLAVQTQMALAARVGILHTRSKVGNSMDVSREI